MVSQVAALLLAAGRSRRMGRLKQLLPVPHKPAIQMCLERIMAAGIEDITVVLGHEGDRVAAAIRHLPVQRIVNPHQDSEMAASVRVGLKAIKTGVTAVMVCLCDHPLVSSATYRRLVQIHRHSPSGIVIPIQNGQNGHPTLFPLDVIHGVFGGRHLKAVIRDHPQRVIRVPVEDAGIHMDMDTMEDYHLACTMAER